MCFSGIPALSVLSMKTTRVLSQRHQAGSPSVARPADLEVAAGRERPAVVQPQGELGHQGRHDRAQARVEPDLLDPEFAHRQGEAAAVLDHHVSRGKLDRGAMEEEIDIVHDHLAVVEIKPAVNVLHSQLESSPGIETRLGRRWTTSRTLESRSGTIEIWLMSGRPGST